MEELLDGLHYEVPEPSDSFYPHQVRAPHNELDRTVNTVTSKKLTRFDIYLCHLYILSLRCVTASVSASASMTQQLLSGRAPRPKPFRVTNADRSVKKGIMADTLEDLMNKVRKGI